VITPRTEALKPSLDLLLNAMERWSKHDKRANMTHVNDVFLRHVVPEKQEVYLTVRWSGLNAPSLTGEIPEAMADEPLKDRLMEAISERPLGGFLKPYFFQPGDLADLTVVGSMVEITDERNGDEGIRVQLMGQNARSLMRTPPKDTPQYRAPLGLRLAYDPESGQMTHTLAEDAHLALLSDPAYAEVMIGVELQCEATLRLTLMPERVADFQRQVVLMQWEARMDTPRQKPYGQAAPRGRTRWTQDDIQPERRGGTTLPLDDPRWYLNAWAAVVLQRRDVFEMRHATLSDYVAAHDLERQGQPPIRHTPRPGEGFGFERQYTHARGHLVPPEAPTGESSSKDETPSSSEPTA